MDSKLTGKIIQQKRNELGLTQIQLAQKLNVSNRTISKWEKGDGYPDITLLEDISNIFGISIDELLTGKAKENDVDIKEEKTEIKPKSRMNFIIYSIIGFCLLIGTTVAGVGCEISLLGYRPFYVFIEIYLLIGIISLYVVSLIIYLVGIAKYKFEAEALEVKDKIALCSFIALSSVIPVAIAFRMLRWYSYLLSYVVMALWLVFIVGMIIFVIKRYIKNEKDS